MLKYNTDDSCRQDLNGIISSRSGLLGAGMVIIHLSLMQVGPILSRLDDLVC